MGECDLKSLSDRRILYLRNPPKFMHLFVLAVVIILAGTIIWSAVTVKAEEIESQGIIVVSDTSDVTPETSAAVTNIYYKDGDTVSLGDKIIVMDSSQVQVERQSYVSELQKNQNLQSHIERMIVALKADSVDKDYENPFVEDSADQMESEYYNKYEAYLYQKNTYTTKDQKESLRYQELSQLYSDLETCTGNITSYQDKILAYDATISTYTITAKSAGVLHFDSDVSVGTILSAGTKIGSISPEDGERTIEAYVSSADRARMEVGDECRFTVNGLMQSEYGSATGVIKSISSNAISNTSGVFFKVVISFEQSSMKSHGKEVSIINGMTVNAWIIYEKSTYLQYFINKFTT